MTSKETRLLEAVKAENKITRENIAEMLHSYRNNPAPIDSPLHQELIQKIDKMGEHIKDNLSQTLGKIDIIDKKAERIEAQTIKTNGRVTALEVWKSAIVNKGQGAWIVIGIVGLGLFQVALKFIK